MDMPHGISIGGYSTEKAENVSIVTAKSNDGTIPAWNSGTSKAWFYMPLTAKKDGLILQTLSFCIKGYMAGIARVRLFRPGMQNTLADKSAYLLRGDNNVALHMGSVALDKDVEYQLRFDFQSNAYMPCVESKWVVENDYIDIAHGGSYYGGDPKVVFAGTVGLSDAMFEYLHTYRDLYLIPVCRPIVQAPTEKTMTLDIEGLNGQADLSNSLTGYPVFNDREGSWQFYLDTERYQEEHGFYGPVGDMAYRDIQRKLMARMRAPFRTKVILDDEPLVYYIGRVWVSEKPSYQYDHAKITLQYRLYPFKYLAKEPNGDWLWDPFCFETDLATPQMKNVAINAGEEKTFTLVDTDKPSAVFVSSSGKAAAALRIQNGENVTLIEDACVKFRVAAKDENGQKVDLRRTELVYPVTVKDYPLQMTSAAMYLVFSSAGAKSLTFYVRKAGLSTTLSSCRVVTSVADYEVGNIKEIKADWTVRLEANTGYEFGVRSTEKVEGMFRIGSAGQVCYESEYLQVTLGDAIVSKIGDIRTVFGGELSFYAGSGVVVSPGVRTDVAIMTGGVSVNRYEVVVKAEEDANVTVEYRPAFL